MTFYKLRDGSTGLFSQGSYWKPFNVEGKTWRRLRDVKSHLKMRYGTNVPDSLQVVEGTFVPVGTVVKLAKDL